MSEQVFKIGQRIAFDKEIELQGMDGEKRKVRKDDEGFVDSDGMIHIVTGDLEGKVIPDKLKVKGYDTRGIANILYTMSIEAIEEQRPPEDIVEIFEEVLEQILNTKKS